MHEMGIAQSVIGILEKEIEARPGARLLEATLRVGEYSGVDTESLRFCLEIAVKDTGLDSVSFRLERSPDDALDLRDLEMEVP